MGKYYRIINITFEGVLFMKDFWWNIFEKSGNVDAFLAYRQSKTNISESDKEELWTKSKSEQLY